MAPVSAGAATSRSGPSAGGSAARASAAIAPRPQTTQVRRDMAPPVYHAGEMDPGLLALVACPRCGGALRPAREGTECGRCDVRFPEPGGVPCLMPDPAAAMDRWRGDAQRLVSLIETGVAAMDEQRKRVDLLPSTRGRLDRMRAAHPENSQRVAELFRAAGLPPRDDGATSSDLGLIEYYEQILRDWAWD